MSSLRVLPQSTHCDFLNIVTEEMVLEVYHLGTKSGLIFPA